ncbi:hypothetical protein [Bdellovibrio sp. HCB337]|uniref:hypothetical protein n=1 Tax=Bdellovibrio sp. HCB337 TaxID=3394358 RepID=UPI0039A5901E
MKTMIAMAFALLTASSAFAGKYTVDTSWEVLNKATDLHIEMPIVFMGHAVSYDFICVEGNNLRTKTMVDITVPDQRGGHGERSSIVVGQEYLTTPIDYAYTETQCHYIGQNQQVCEEKLISGTYATTVDVKVYKLSRGNERDNHTYLFTKAFTVPECSTSVLPN